MFSWNVCPRKALFKIFPHIHCFFDVFCQKYITWFPSPLIICLYLFKNLTIIWHSAWKNVNRFRFHPFIIIQSPLHCHMLFFIIIFWQSKYPIVFQWPMPPLIPVHLNQSIPFNIYITFTIFICVWLLSCTPLCQEKMLPQWL